jgi:hypothetical protein
VVEAAFLLPMLVFTFMGVFDIGFFCWAQVATQNAARAIALYAAGEYAKSITPSSSVACGYALEALRTAPNVGNSLSACSAAPLEVTVSSVNGPYGAQSARATVVYRTITLLPVPGMISGQITISRTAEMRI